MGSLPPAFINMTAENLRFRDPGVPDVGGRCSFGNRNLLNVTGFDPETEPFRYSVNQNVGVVQRGGSVWQVQLGARYAF